MHRLICLKQVTHLAEMMHASSSTTSQLPSLFDSQTELHIIRLYINGCMKRVFKWLATEAMTSEYSEGVQ